MPYASAGAPTTDAHDFPYIPLHAGRKNAKGSWKQYQTEKADPETVQQWRDDGLNLGVVTGLISGVVVIDLDDADAIAMAKEKGLPPTPAVRTPRGEHHYYRWPEAGLRNKTAIFDGIDFRGEGGYVVAAGSTFEPTEKEIADGKVAGSYEWIKGTEQIPFADLPQWFMDACEGNKPAKSVVSVTSFPANQNRPDEYGRKALDSEIANLKSAGEGSRNNELNRSAFALGQLIASGDLAERATGFALMAAALEIGLDEEESQKTIASGFAAGMASPRDTDKVQFSAADSGNADRVLQKAKQNRSDNVQSKTESSNCFTMISFADTEAVLDGKWLIKGVFPACGISCTFGHPGTMKSFLMLDMALHVALGWDWLGRKTEQGLVIYIAAEGATGMKNRIVAFRDAHDVQEAPPFVLIPCPVNMRDDEADMPKLVRSIQAAIAEHGAQPTMIVIDTLAKTFGSGEENGSDMVAYMSNSEVIAAEFDCLINIVHHRPKDEMSKEPRGHSSLRGGVETLLLLEGKPEVRAEIVKQKDGPEGRLCSFRLNEVVLGNDSDGEPVTSAVIEKTEYREPVFLDRSPRDIARSKLNDRQRISLECLGSELERNGISIPSEIPAELIGNMISKVADRDAWRDAFLSQISEGETARDASRDADRRAFNRIKEKLQSTDIIGVFENYVWIK